MFYSIKVFYFFSRKTPLYLFLSIQVLATPLLATPCERGFSNQTVTKKKGVKVVKLFKIPKTQEEKTLRAKGIREDYISGIDSANYMLKLGKKLRESNIDLARTHIEDFVLLVPLHIEFARQSLEAQNIELSERLNILNNFRKEAERRIKNQAVTYQWWLVWNFRLIILLTPKTLRIPFMIHIGGNLDWWLNGESATKAVMSVNMKQNSGTTFNLQMLVNRFPETIALPTINDLGIIAMNRVFSVDGVFPLGIIGTIKKADGREMNPKQFFHHDISHSGLIKNFKKDALLIKQFHDYFIQHVHSFSAKEQEQLEFIYFMAIHENDTINPLNFTQKVSLKSLIRKVKARHESLLPTEYIEPNLISQYVEDSMQVFARLFQQWQNRL